MSNPLPDAALDQLFREARTQNGFTDREVPDVLIHAVYELAKLGPTAGNSSPARLVFIKSPEARARLNPHLSSSNRDKPIGGAVTCIIAYDLNFAEHIPFLFPHNPGSAAWYQHPAVAQETAFRNSSLQGAYLMLAARALGLDAGPMSGFNKVGVDEEFFAGTQIKSNFLCNLGYGSGENLFPRHPRLSFDQACQIL